MTEQQASKLAIKIKRCLSSVPDDVIVIVGSNSISVIDKHDYYENEVCPERCTNLAYECGGMKNILGYEEWT